MARAMCQQPGCTNVVEHGRYCAEHAYSHSYKRAKRKKASVYHHDNKPVYRSDEWKSVCYIVDQREHNCCQHCGKFCYGRDKQHHHIIPIKDDPSLEFEPNNIMLLCSKCHPIVEHEHDEHKPNVYASYFNATN